MAPPDQSAPARSVTVEILNRRGLHARAAAKFVKTAGRHGADIWVERNGVRVAGRSIMGLMMLAAGPGSAITIHAEGPGADAALADLAALIGRKFDED